MYYEAGRANANAERMLTQGNNYSEITECEACAQLRVGWSVIRGSVSRNGVALPVFCILTLQGSHDPTTPIAYPNRVPLRIAPHAVGVWMLFTHIMPPPDPPAA